MINLNQAVEQIKKANPVFGYFLDSNDTLSSYVKTQLTAYLPHPTHKERQKNYHAEINNEINRLFSKGEVNINFKEELILDTCDHHNLLNFPTTLGAHLLTHLDTILDRKNHGDYFVLDTGNVPFTEVLHKRGINFAGKHINLYPKKDRNKLTSHYPIYKFNFVKSALNSEKTFSQEEMDFLKHVNDLVDNIDFTTCQDFSDQVVKINLALWLEMFGADAKIHARRCITLEHNHILRRFLPNFLLTQKDNFVWNALFDPSYRSMIMNEFSGNYGAWDYAGKGSGTHFFWGATPNGEQTKFILDGNILKDPSGQIKDIPMTPEAIAEGLENNILIPSIFTKFSLIAFYLGTKVMGGPGQTEFLPKLKTVWIKILEQTDSAEAELAKQVPADVVNTFDIAFSRTPNKKIFKQWGFDIVQSHTFTRDYLQNLNNLPLKEALKPCIPISYYRLTPANKRQEINFNEQDLYSGFSWIK